MTLGGLGEIDAAAITVDLGPSQILNAETTKISFAALNGLPIGGGASLDIVFSGNKFVRLFSGSSAGFQAAITFRTTAIGTLGFLNGTGYLRDAGGNAIPGFGVIGSASGSDGTLTIGFFPLASNKTGALFNWLPRPVDFYGIHYDFAFPNSPLHAVVGGEFTLAGNGKPFGVGPGVPTDVDSPDRTLGSLANISTRAFVQTGDNVLIGGFIVRGTQNKRVLWRAIGPSLQLGARLANPALELHDRTGALIASNDNWSEASNYQEIAATGAAPTNPLESAILKSLAPGLYTVIVRGVGNTAGIGLVEGYDLDGAHSSEFLNISTRGLVQTQDNVMIGGFIVAGTASQDVVVRALGPSLPLAGRLPNPTLTLHNTQGIAIASNDDWRTTQETELMATGIQPTNNFESAIARRLTPGRYTAIVRGANNATGVALIEIYAVN